MHCYRYNKIRFNCPWLDIAAELLEVVGYKKLHLQAFEIAMITL